MDSKLQTVPDLQKAATSPGDGFDTLTQTAQSGVKPPSIWEKLISFPAMLGTLLLGGIFWSLRQFIVDPDMWWHVKVGQTILATHHWPTVDPYSFTVNGQPWMAYEWLGEVDRTSVV